MDEIQGCGQLQDNWIIEKMCQHWGQLQDSGTVGLSTGWQEALFEMLLFTAVLTELWARRSLVSLISFIKFLRLSNCVVLELLISFL